MSLKKEKKCETQLRQVQYLLNPTGVSAFKWSIDIETVDSENVTAPPPLEAMNFLSFLRNEKGKREKGRRRIK